MLARALESGEHSRELCAGNHTVCFWRGEAQRGNGESFNPVHFILLPPGCCGVALFPLPEQCSVHDLCQGRAVQ